MNDASKTLRALLILAVAFAVLAGVTDVLLPGAVPEQAREAFRTVLASRPLAHGTLVLSLGLAYWLLLIGALVGLFRNRRWGLQLAIVVTVVTMVQALLLGPHAYSGAAFMLSYVSKVLWGAALALAWVRTSAGAAQ